MKSMKSLIITLVVCLVFTSIPFTKAAASETLEAQNIATEVIEEEFEVIKEEVYEELGMEHTDEIDVELTNINEETINIESSFQSEDIELESELELDIESEDINLQTTYTDENGEEIYQEFEVIVEQVEGEEFLATFIDKTTGETYTYNSEELSASALPAIIVGVIIRSTVKIAFKLYSRSQILKALMNVSFKASQLQKKFKHAKDFGVTGNYSKANATKFETALRNHVSKSTHIYKTKHSGQSNPVIMHIKGNNAVFFKENGDFITGYKLTTTQKNNFIRIGELIIKR
ncbi:SAR2788 family putative toxin [Bacillus sinesaloumensis]|uniref:SAR2788 family putative toxin n=1 Tax=Litchfieldia sinesaloumensis TaxID=1926280 RepID=UPI00098878D3|nr:SAR2788 family putative toxin [Bacillus sinesaloumensis]